MKVKDLKYIGAYLIPVLTLVGLLLKGGYSYLTPFLIFGVIPILEYFTPEDVTNLEQDDAMTKKEMRIFDWLLYFNIPIIYGLIFLFLYIAKTEVLSTFELTGLLLSLGISMGSNGINVAHELGHRPEKFHKFLSKTLLIPSMYGHFMIEHTLGHHKNVGTDKDPASAKKNDIIYIFWIKSVVGTYINAWKLEQRRLKGFNAIPSFFKNQMVITGVLQILLLVGIYIYTGFQVSIYFLLAALTSILLLETINYVEHYGLRRKFVNGRHERVTPVHSWNSNHEIGRILLYELTRHSDHHFIANKKYQLLDHKEESKQLPFGYPASMLISLVPPIWFKLMNQRLD